MEKTLEIQLQEERERIARNIEGELCFYLRNNHRTDVDPNLSLGFSQGLAYIADRVKKNFNLESATIRYTNR